MSCMAHGKMCPHETWKACHTSTTTRLHILKSFFTINNRGKLLFVCGFIGILWLCFSGRRGRRWGGVVSMGAVVFVCVRSDRAVDTVQRVPCRELLLPHITQARLVTRHRLVLVFAFSELMPSSSGRMIVIHGQENKTTAPIDLWGEDQRFTKCVQHAH